MKISHYREYIASPEYVYYDVLLLTNAEGGLLTAGCLVADGDSEKARAALVVAHGQYQSDKRIKESRTPNLSNMNAFGGLDTLHEDEDEVVTPQKDSDAAYLDEYMVAASVVPSGSTAENYEREVFGAETFEKWDFAKQKEYSCREQIMPALVCLQVT